jgi:hypothetical protein
MLLFTLTITGIQSFLKCLGVYSRPIYLAFEVYSIALYIVNIEQYVVKIIKIIDMKNVKTLGEHNVKSTQL